jgi:hypothetical protein
MALYPLRTTAVKGVAHITQIPVVATVNRFHWRFLYRSVQEPQVSDTIVDNPPGEGYNLPYDPAETFA